jgi:hypothetical protein
MNHLTQFRTQEQVAHYLRILPKTQLVRGALELALPTRARSGCSDFCREPEFRPAGGLLSACMSAVAGKRSEQRGGL